MVLQSPDRLASSTNMSFTWSSSPQTGWPPLLTCRFLGLPVPDRLAYSTNMSVTWSYSPLTGWPPQCRTPGVGWSSPPPSPPWSCPGVPSLKIKMNPVLNSQPPIFGTKSAHLGVSDVREFSNMAFISLKFWYPKQELIIPSWHWPHGAFSFRQPF